MPTVETSFFLVNNIMALCFAGNCVREGKTVRVWWLWETQDQSERDSIIIHCINLYIALECHQKTHRSHRKLVFLMERCHAGFFLIYEGSNFEQCRENMEWNSTKERTFWLHTHTSWFRVRHMKAVKEGISNGQGIKAQHLETSDGIMIFITQLLKRTDWLFVNCSVK